MDALAGTARCELEVGNMEQAVEHINEIWSYLENNGAEALEFPCLAFLTCARIFEKAGDQERRQKSIEDGYKHLMERAEKISDPEWKEVFCEKIHEHNELLDMVTVE